PVLAILVLAQTMRGDAQALTQPIAAFADGLGAELRRQAFPGLPFERDRRNLDVRSGCKRVYAPLGERLQFQVEQHGLLAELDAQLPEQFLQGIGAGGVETWRAVGRFVGWAETSENGLPGFDEILDRVHLHVVEPVDAR